MMIIRDRIDQLYVFADATEQQLHTELIALGIKHGGNFWKNSGVYKDRLQGLKSNIKSAYYFSQNRRCAFCCFELEDNNNSRDLEHILNKDTFTSYMFSLGNLAISCKTCNGSKSTKEVLSPSGLLNVNAGLPWVSQDYLIVHPHLDEWGDHLEFDQFRRIRSKVGSLKGPATISIAGIFKWNALRVSDHFTANNRQTAVKYLRKLLGPTLTKKTKLKHLDFLKELATKSNSIPAKNILQVIEAEIQ